MGVLSLCILNTFCAANTRTVLYVGYRSVERCLFLNKADTDDHQVSDHEEGEVNGMQTVKNSGSTQVLWELGGRGV